MSGRCGDCFYWKEPEGENEYYGVCRVISEVSRIGVRGRPEPYAFTSRRAAVVIDGKRHIDAQLLTTEDFGCVDFEQA
jgi:hypothetical protein